MILLTKISRTHFIAGILSCGLLTQHSMCMDQPIKKHKKKVPQRISTWVESKIKIKSEKKTVKTVTPAECGFQNLPNDTKTHIVLLLSTRKHATTLTEITRTINSIALVDKQFNQLIHNPILAHQIVKNLATTFQVSDNTVYNALNSPFEPALIAQQEELYQLCKHKENPQTTNLIVQMCQSGTNIRFLDEHRYPLEECIQKNNLQTLTLLLENGLIKPNEHLGHGENMLTFAVTLDRIDVARLLLQYGADQLEFNYNKFNAENIAHQLNNPNMTQLLQSFIVHKK